MISEQSISLWENGSLNVSDAQFTSTADVTDLEDETVEIDDMGQMTVSGDLFLTWSRAPSVKDCCNPCCRTPKTRKPTHCLL